MSPTRTRTVTPPADLTYITCGPDGSLWFSDPSFGIASDFEGERAEQELPHGVYRIDGVTGELTQQLDDLNGPNGLAFSPDGNTLYTYRDVTDDLGKVASPQRGRGGASAS